MKDLSRCTFLQNVGIGIGATTFAATVPSFINPNKTTAKNYDGKKLNIALCGLGRYAGCLAYGLETSQYYRLAGIVTGTPAKAAGWKKKYNIPGKNIYDYAHFYAIVNNNNIDLV